jgi:hypothetical protein
MRLAIGAVLAGVLGYGGYVYWQGLQGEGSQDRHAVTAELASAYSSLNDNKLGSAAAAFNNVLKLDGSNVAAEQGLGEVQTLFQQAIEQALRNNDVAGASQLVTDYAGYFSTSADLERYQSEFELLREEQRLLAARSKRIELLLKQADQSVQDGELEQARTALEQAKVLAPKHPGLGEMQTVLEQAEARAFAYQQRWAAYSDEQRQAFSDALTGAEIALAENRLDDAEQALSSAAHIAPDVPELAEPQQQLVVAREALAEQQAQRQAVIDGVLQEADAALADVEADPTLAREAARLYQDVLRDDPDNAAAQAGLSNLVDHYVTDARAAIEVQDFALAGEVLTAAEDVIPGQAAIGRLQEELPALVKAREEKQAAAERERELAARARQRATEAARKGETALSRGNLDVAQQAYDKVVADYPDLPAVVELKQALGAAYAQAARNQMESREFDAALEYVALGAVLAPNDPAWVELEQEIETAKTKTRRRMGAY